MTTSGYSLVLRDVSLIDLEELKANAPSADIAVIQPDADSENHNELATILIVILSAPIVTAVGAWLLKNRESELIEYKVTVRRPDGSEVVVDLKIKRTSSTPPDAQIVKQIAAALAIPENAVVGAS